MLPTTERERLVRHAARLRRAERTSPAAEEIATVRADLERLAGPTVPRAMAARLLGVSQTALDRWVASGDIPVVLGRTGRREVPLHSLIDILDELEQANHAVERHPLAAVLRRRRSDAEHLELRKIVPAGRRAPGDGHAEAELRSLAYHRAVAQRLDDRILDRARERLSRWREEGRIDPRYADAWEEVLSRPRERIARLIGQDSERARALRQSSPFAGTLTEPERRRVLEAVVRRRT